jgi:hypothetical protein
VIGFDFLLGWIMFNVCLVDLLDLRYNNERSVILIPNITISWTGKGKAAIWSLIFSWLNLELSIIAINFDHYCDKLEDILEKMDTEKEEKNEEE